MKIKKKSDIEERIEDLISWERAVNEGRSDKELIGQSIIVPNLVLRRKLEVILELNN